MVGFFVGIIYENIIAKREIVGLDLFLKSNLQMYLQTNIVVNSYVWYVVKERLILFAWIFVFSCLKWKKIFVVTLLCLSGFFMGTLVVMAVLQLGIGGILLCIAAMLPQGIFYGVAGYVLLVYWYFYPNQRWNQAKSLFVFLMLGVGIVMEIYTNPIIIKWVIQMIC